MPDRFDVVVVGARCAGSATALLLARSGHRVLLVDRDDFPSDMKASTHLVWQSGVERLDRWGLIERLDGTGSTPMRSVLLDMGELRLRGTPPSANGEDRAFAPRRVILDAMLLDAAREAGAEFLAGCSFVDVVRSGGRVTGIRYETAGGESVEVEADVVVGADGRTSRVAEAVGAETVDEHPRHQGTIWAYFSDLPIDDMEFYSRPGRMVYAWYSSSGETLAGICYRYDDYLPVAKDADARMPAEFRALVPEFADRLARAERRSEWNAGATRGFVRRAHGPGWALVGDAGLTMDPITAAGITNAFRDAESLSTALDEGLTGARPMDEALADYQARRDAVSGPLYAFARDMARLDPPDPFVVDLFTALAGNPADTSAYFGVFAQTVPVAEFFDPENVGRIIAAAT